jgi:putative transcriptional regulator
MTLKRVAGIPDPEAARIFQADAAFAREFKKDRGEVLRNLAMNGDPLRDLTDEEEAAIQAGIALDPENPELTAEQIDELRPLHELHPDLTASLDRARDLPTVIIGPEDAAAFGWTPEEIAACEEAAGKNWRARVAVETASQMAMLPALQAKQETYRKITVRQIDRASTRPITAEEIRALRERAGIRQGVLAHRLNLSTGYVAALERGAKIASGPALVLLDLIRRKGIEAIL